MRYPNSSIKYSVLLVAVALVALLAAAPASAQLQTGAVYAPAKDQARRAPPSPSPSRGGRRKPGPTRRQFRFSSSPRHRPSRAHSFSTATTRARINVGRNRDPSSQCNPPSSDAIYHRPATRDSARPRRRHGHPTELEKIPGTRPWAILQTIPASHDASRRRNESASSRVSRQGSTATGGVGPRRRRPQQKGRPRSSPGYTLRSLEESRSQADRRHHRHRRSGAQHGHQARHQRVARQRPPLRDRPRRRLRRAARPGRSRARRLRAGPRRRVAHGARQRHAAAVVQPGQPDRLRARLRRRGGRADRQGPAVGGAVRRQQISCAPSPTSSTSPTSRGSTASSTPSSPPTTPPRGSTSTATR